MKVSLAWAPCYAVRIADCLLEHMGSLAGKQTAVKCQVAHVHLAAVSQPALTESHMQDSSNEEFMAALDEQVTDMAQLCADVFSSWAAKQVSCN